MLPSQSDPVQAPLEDDGSGEPAPMGPGFVIAIVIAAAVVITLSLIG